MTFQAGTTLSGCHMTAKNTPPNELRPEDFLIDLFILNLPLWKYYYKDIDALSPQKIHQLKQDREVGDRPDGMGRFFSYVGDLTKEYTFDLPRVKAAIFNHLAGYIDKLIPNVDYWRDDYRMSVDEVFKKHNRPPLSELDRFATGLTIDAPQMGILHIPPSIYQFNQLESLKLFQPDQELLQHLHCFPRLKYLTIRGNTVSELPRCIWRLPLEELNLHHTNIEQLPQELGSMTTLKKLSLWNAPINHIPEEIGNLRQLKYLTISELPIDTIPATIGHCQNLEDLEIGELPGVTEVPEEIWQLHRLQKFMFYDTSATKLSPKIGELSQLRELSLEGFDNYPKSLARLKRLRYVDIDIPELTDHQCKVFMSQRPADLEIFFDYFEGRGEFSHR